MIPNPEMFGPATFAVGQSVASFTAFLPKFSEVRQRTPNDDPSFAADVRMGEIASVTVSMGVGLIASSLTGSPIPAVVTLLVCLILVTLYESALNADRPMEPKRSLTIVRSGEKNA
jgi:hypothetical protein